jgi:hypothetical protein
MDAQAKEIKNKVMCELSITEVSSALDHSNM